MVKKQDKREKSIRRASLIAPCATVFIGSACIMVLELVAGRIVARHLGSSLYTWTSVIGVVLAGITLGNYFGGRIADRFVPQKTLAVLFAACSVACIVTIIMNNLVGGWGWLWHLNWPGHVFAHVSLVFLLPSTLLGTISPVVAKMALDRGLPTGRTVGDIYAWGAAGSIIGTFVTGYYLIAVMGTVAIIWVVSGALLLMAILYWVRLWPLYIWAVIFCCLCTMGMAPWSENIGVSLALKEEPDPATVYQDESQYSYIKVKRLSEKPDKREFLLDRLTHSEIIMGDVLDLQYDYSQIFAAATKRLSADKDNLSVMIIGGGGYVFPRYIKKLWPDSRVDVVEIDPAVTEAAIEAFGLERNTSIHTIAMDARNYVDEQLKGDSDEQIRYDFIYEDAISDYSVPFQLVTHEFNEKIAQLLTDDGVYMVNLVDVFDQGLFLGAFLKTIEKTFSCVEVFSQADKPRMDRNTFVVIAAKHQINLDDLANDYKRKKLHLWHLTQSEIESLKDKAGGMVLSDDYVPVENLLAPVVRQTSIDFLVTGYMEHAEQLAQGGKLDESMAVYQKVLRLKPPLSVKVYNRTAAILGRQKKWQEQIEVLRKAVQYNAQAEFKVPMGGAHYNLATALRKLGKSKENAYHLDRAAEEFRLQLRDNPNSAKTLTNLGHCLAERDNFQEATKFFRQALESDPTRPSRYINLAMSLKMQQRREEAIKVLRKGHKFMSSRGQKDMAARLQEYLEPLEFEQ